MFALATLRLSPIAAGDDVEASGLNSVYVVSTSISTMPPRRAVVLQDKRKDVLRDNVHLGQQVALERGIEGREWECLYQLGMRESGWNHLAVNISSGAFGIPQALPASKLDAYGDRNDPAVQIRWMIDYIFKRYITSCRALSFQIANKWY